MADMLVRLSREELEKIQQALQLLSGDTVEFFSAKNKVDIAVRRQVIDACFEDFDKPENQADFGDLLADLTEKKASLREAMDRYGIKFVGE